MTYANDNQSKYLYSDQITVSECEDVEREKFCKFVDDEKSVFLWLTPLKACLSLVRQNAIYHNKNAYINI